MRRASPSWKCTIQRTYMIRSRSCSNSIATLSIASLASLGCAQFRKLLAVLSAAIAGLLLHAPTQHLHLTVLAGAKHHLLATVTSRQIILTLSAFPSFAAAPSHLVRRMDGRTLLSSVRPLLVVSGLVKSRSANF